MTDLLTHALIIKPVLSCDMGMISYMNVLWLQNLKLRL